MQKAKQNTYAQHLENTQHNHTDERAADATSCSLTSSLETLSVFGRVVCISKCCACAVSLMEMFS